MIDKSAAYPACDSSGEFLDVKGVVTVSVISFLLARAFIMDGIMPFGVAFFSTAVLNRCGILPVIVSTAAGLASVGGLTYTGRHIASMALIFFLTRILLRKKALNRHMVSLITFLSMLGVSLGLMYFGGGSSIYDLFMASFEAFAAGVLMYIFDYTMPVIKGFDKRKLISREELICIAVTSAIALSGLGPVRVWHISIKVLMMAVLTLMSGYIGGAASGSAVGVVFGVVSGLATDQAAVIIGVYAFAGLLAGTFKELGRTGSVLGFIIGSAILNLYLRVEMKTVISMEELLAASFIFFMIPNRILEQLSGITSVENVKLKNRDAYNARGRELASIRLKEFSKIFGQLSATFNDISFTENFADSRAINRLFDGICCRVCKGCGLYRSCWEKEFYTTYQLMFNLICKVEEKGGAEPGDMPQDLAKRCIRSEMLVETVNYLFDIYRINYKWQLRMEDCRHLVSQQLDGMSQVIENLAGEVDIDMKFKEDLEESIYVGLDREGIQASQVMVVEKPGNRLEVYIEKKSCYGCRECVKKIVPAVSGVTGRRFNKPGFMCNIRNETCSLKLVEAQRYNVATGIYSSPKAENQVSGDNYTYMELKDCKYLIALSDGMGTGAPAAMESSVAINLLEQLLEVGYDHELAIKTINSILMLKSPEDSFSTLDVMLIDLYTGDAKVIKIGAPPTYIKRDDQVKVVSSRSLPVGIVSRLDIQAKKITVKDGDFIVMMTDGIWDAGGMEEQERWVDETLKGIRNRNPQEMARMLFEKAMERCGGEAQDDMTVLVARIWED